MNSKFLKLPVIAATLGLAACNSATASNQQGTPTFEYSTDADAVMGNIPDPDPAEIEAFRAATRELYDLKEQAFAENQVDPIVQRFYAENVVSVGPDGAPKEGRAALRAEYETVVPTSTVRVESIHTYVNGDAGWDWANFHVTPTDPAEGEPFTFVILFLWTKVDGRWVSAGDAYVVGSFNQESGSAE